MSSLKWAKEISRFGVIGVLLRSTSKACALFCARSASGLSAERRWLMRVAPIATIYWAPGERMRSGSCELGWIPQQGLEVFLADMLTDAVRAQQSA